MNETNTATDPTQPPYDGYGSSDTSSMLRPQLFRMLSPLHRRFLAVLVPLAVIAIVYAVEFTRQEHEFRKLWADVTNAGGELHRVDFLAEAVADLPYPFDRLFADKETQAYLTGGTIDGEWLRQHDDLTTVGITVLAVYESSLSGSEIARLVEKHPVEVLSVNGVREADRVARALSTRRSLKHVAFYNSDLTDSGLNMLPLEFLTGIGVAGSPVTTEGLHELRRCRQLQSAGLDGHQFDNSVAELLCGQLRIRVLELGGRSVTDGHLKQLAGTAVLRLTLTNTSVTTAGIKALQAALPDCRIHIFNDPAPVRDSAASE